MKEYKVIQLNDGRPEMKTNGNWHYGEENVWIQKMLGLYAAVGFRVVSMTADYRPGEAGGKGYAFYKEGYVFTLEREGGGPDITTEMWNAVNNPALSDDAFEQMEECLRNGGTEAEYFAICESDFERTRERFRNGGMETAFSATCDSDGEEPNMKEIELEEFIDD